MRRGVAVGCVLLLAGTGSVRAQVTTDQRALDQLGPAHRPATAKPHAAAHAAPHAAAHPAHPPAHPTAHSPARHAAPVAAAPARRIGPAPKIPLHPPAPPIIAPPALHVDLHKPPLPPAPPIDAKAPGEATAIPGGTQITFGAGGSSLNPTTDAALRAIATRAAAAPDDVVDIASYAAPVAEDPSTPRRLSLQRALTARAVLIEAGIASTRIYPRALGAAPEPPLGSVSPQPDDRIEVVLEHADHSVDDGTRGGGNARGRAAK